MGREFRRRLADGRLGELRVAGTARLVVAGARLGTALPRCWRRRPLGLGSARARLLAAPCLPDGLFRLLQRETAFNSITRMIFFLKHALFLELGVKSRVWLVERGDQKSTTELLRVN